MNRERLAKLSWLLRNLEKEVPQVDIFTLDVFVQSEADEMEYGQFTVLNTRKDCGMAACACGAAALHPWFREQGFLWDDEEVEVIYENLTNWDAVQKFFGLTSQESFALFDPEAYEDGFPENVAARIDNFLATGRLP